jgi:hypothetical protein
MVMDALGSWIIPILSILQVATVTACPGECTCSFKETTCKNTTFTSIPSGISRDTTVISFSYNSIPALRGRELANLDKLTDIFMNDNNIETIEAEFFRRLKNLRRLQLNNNRIASLHYQTFLGAKSLRYLFLENNKIDCIDVRLFQYVKKLKVLDISRNRLKKLEPNTFQYNRLLSWVNIRHNQYIDTIGWKTIFKYSLNFSDIQFCYDKISFYETYIRPSKHESNNKYYSGINSQLNRKNDKFETGDKLIIKYSFVKSENLSFEEYDAFIRTVGYDEYTTIITRENYYVTILTDYPIFCYCESHSVWFWCHELEANCSNNTSILITFTVSKCSSENPKNSRLPISVLPNSTVTKGNSGSETNEDFTHSGKTSNNSNSTQKFVIYASISIGIVLIMIIIAGIFIQKQKRIRRQRTLRTDRIIELENVKKVSANSNSHSSLLQEPYN